MQPLQRVPIVADLSARAAEARSALCGELLALRNGAGHWTGRLSSSALSTATAVSALSLVCRCNFPEETSRREQGTTFDRLIAAGLQWLARTQNADGGWGDTDRSLSNLSTTALACAAFRLGGRTDRHRGVLEKAERYLDACGGPEAIAARYGSDKTFAVPILMNLALAGMVPWPRVDPLPFELACLPQSMFHLARMPVVSYAIPALVAVGQAVFFHRRPANPLVRWLRSAVRQRSLEVVRRMQPSSGGFLEAVPLTSFVVMALASCERVGSPVVTHGVQFLVESVRSDGSWPIDTNLATWVTTLSIGALAAAEREHEALGAIDWLLGCQHRQRHPFTGAAPGGWGWSDLPGAVPDVDDTSGALLALASLLQCGEEIDADERARIVGAARDGLRWLVELQNADGGWPTFCRGWGRLPFDRSCADLTAHALRAMIRWIDSPAIDHRRLARRMLRAIARGVRYLLSTQRADGSWVPLWFGNQYHKSEENPVYGTSRVLLALEAIDRWWSHTAEGVQLPNNAPIATTGLTSRAKRQMIPRLPAAEIRRRMDRAVSWLATARNPDGGWGNAGPADLAHAEWREGRPPACRSSVEETALAVEALAALGPQGPARRALLHGTEWLLGAIGRRLHRQATPIGFYFASLWYYEQLYPLVFSLAALGRFVRWAAGCETPARAASTQDNPAADRNQGTGTVLHRQTGCRTTGGDDFP